MPNQCEIAEENVNRQTYRQTNKHFRIYISRHKHRPTKFKFRDAQHKPWLKYIDIVQININVINISFEGVITTTTLNSKLYTSNGKEHKMYICFVQFLNKLK